MSEEVSSKFSISSDFIKYYTSEGGAPLNQIEWTKSKVVVTDDGGNKKIEIEGVECPASWSEMAVTIFASKYFNNSTLINDGKGERSIRDVITRIVDVLSEQGFKQGYFADEKTKNIFRNELAYILVNQMAAFNSPVWFNCGLFEKYGLIGDKRGNYYYDYNDKTIKVTDNFYEHPQLSACFIQGIKDDLIDIAEHVKREMKIFSGGSGTGTNFSNLRGVGEPLSTGGTSSGVMSFLKIFDTAAGSTKSGGKNRRAAKMVILDANHPEIIEFIQWKAKEERKAKILLSSSDSEVGKEAYNTISGQNGNNSVRLSDEFMDAVRDDLDWELKSVTTNETVKTIKAREIFEEICKAAWECGDPAVQFSSTINAWHTCPKSGEIRASNPCSEFLFLDNSSCNLASINLVKFLRNNGSFDIDGFQHVIKIMFIAQDIIVDYASYPTREICENTHNFRPIGLGYTNLAALLMQLAIPYDSDQGRAMAAVLTSIMTGTAYLISSYLAEALGCFEMYKRNKTSMQKVIEKHRKLAIASINDKLIPEDLYDVSCQTWDLVVERGKKIGFRNAQATVLAPTGTISLIMDCDTTGIEPEYSLVKIKKYSDGGFSKIVNKSVGIALRNLGYKDEEIQNVILYMVGRGHLPDNGNIKICIPVLRNYGFSDEIIDKINTMLPKCLSVNDAISMVPEAMNVIHKLYARDNDDKIDNPLATMGFTKEEIEEVDIYSCGMLCIEGSGVKDEHLSIFDCASKCGKYGKRNIDYMGHLKMLAAVQPFISGGISKTINMPHDVTIADIWDVFYQAWINGIKCVAIYRDGCKAIQPLDSGKRIDKLQKSKWGAVRRRLPMQREGGKTLEVKIAGHKLFITANTYADGKVGEIFINASKPNSTIGGLLHCFARMVSLGLQFGVPIEKLINTFKYEEFEPYGPTTHPKISSCKSIVDFLFKWLELEFVSKNKNMDIDEELGNDFIEDIENVTMPDIVPDKCCFECGSSNLRRTGNCFVCLECGASQGCS